MSWFFPSWALWPKVDFPLGWEIQCEWHTHTYSTASSAMTWTLLLIRNQSQINIKGSIEERKSWNDSFKGVFKEQGSAQPLYFGRGSHFFAQNSDYLLHLHIRITWKASANLCPRPCLKAIKLIQNRAHT